MLTSSDRRILKRHTSYDLKNILTLPKCCPVCTVLSQVLAHTYEHTFFPHENNILAVFLMAQINAGGKAERAVEEQRDVEAVTCGCRALARGGTQSLMRVPNNPAVG